MRVTVKATTSKSLQTHLPFQESRKSTEPLRERKVKNLKIF